MTFENEINIKGLYSLYPNILGILLHDNTTKKNIIWATVHYQNKGLGYSITDEIKPCHLNGKVRAIRPRIEKSKAEQTKRSKDNAEVFTPSWIVNKQNNLADNAWFGRENRFNTENQDNSWSPTEKQFVLEIVDKCASLSNDERKWELSKIYYFDCDSEKKKQNEVHDSMMAEALKIMLSTFNQPMKDSLLMENLTINEEYEVNTVFGKSKQERQRELTIQEIEQRSFFKTMLDSGCQCMLQIKQVPCISEEDTFEFLEGKVVEVPMKINDKLENNGLFINFGGYQQLDAIRNWKLYSLSEYKSMTDVSRTKYLKALVNYKYSNPSRYFESLRKYYEQDYLKEVNEIC